MNHKTINSIGGKDRNHSEKSHSTLKSKKTLTALELKEYFKQNEEEIKSKFSQMTRGSGKSNLKARLIKKMEREKNSTKERNGEQRNS